MISGILFLTLAITEVVELYTMNPYLSTAQISKEKREHLVSAVMYIGIGLITSIIENMYFW